MANIILFLFNMSTPVPKKDLQSVRRNTASDTSASNFAVNNDNDIQESCAQWRNDGVAAASCDGGPHWQGAPDSSKFLMINF